MKKRLILILSLIFPIFFFMACTSDSGGGGGNWCPGTICNNCATDCPKIELDCAPGETEACVGGSYFDADPNLRCTFCSKD